MTQLGADKFISRVQAGILQAIPEQARYLTFEIEDAEAIRPALVRLQALVDGDRTVLALGNSLFSALSLSVPGLTDAPQIAGSLVPLPERAMNLLLWLRGEDRGELLHRTRALSAALAPAFKMSQCIEAFRHGEGRDLTGYLDGTENPVGEALEIAGFVSAAQSQALLAEQPPGMADAMYGSSFMAVQHWVHDLSQFEARSQDERDLTIGRRISDNEEIEEAPAQAHTKRAEQESYSPEAFLLRRSMPWIAGANAGLVFASFSHSQRGFEVILQRMSGADDGIVDALFSFSTPLFGSFLWCPGMRGGKPDLRLLLG